MQVQFTRLVGYGDELVGNTAVGARDSIAAEMRELHSDWSKLKDNVMDSLVMLQREYDDWVRRERGGGGGGGEGGRGGGGREGGGKGGREGGLIVFTGSSK